MTQTQKNRGVQVVAAGLAINLALGILYTYSILKEEIQKLFDNSADPYATACLAFAFAMVLGGKMQDKFGPRVTATIGGVLVGVGFIICSMSTSYWGWILGFGIFSGLGYGFGYSSATPPALKWFSSDKTGFIAGIVVAGFGIAPVYLAPLSQFLLSKYTLSSTMLILGIFFLLIVCVLATFLKNPPANFTPKNQTIKDSTKKKIIKDVGVKEILKDKKFYILWITFFIGAGTGLMVIGSIAGIAKQSMGSYAFLAVALMAIGNAGGRIMVGLASDKIGRITALFIVMSTQAVLMFISILVVNSSNTHPFFIVLIASLIGFNYGGNLSLFPSFVKDFWGVKNYGINYGVLFLAWGIGGFVLVKFADILKSSYGVSAPFLAAGALLLLSSALSLILIKVKDKS
ncbi:MAG: OFA family MFS transporter [Campylobacteraceae bacterium]